MRLCDKCGEYSKVRRRETPFETTFYSLYTTYFNTSVVDYICKKCETAEKIEGRKKYKENKLKRKLKKEEERKSWIKKRDKLLEKEAQKDDKHS